MITEDFYKNRLLKYYFDEKAFRMVCKFFEDKAKEAKIQGDRKKEQAYLDVHILFLKRNIKMQKEMKQLEAQYEHQKREDRLMYYSP